MKMKAEFNLEGEPEELRRFFGWPDTKKLQEEMIELVRSKMKAGTEGFDPLTLMMKPFGTESLKVFQDMQKSFWQNISETSTQKEQTQNKNSNKK